MVQDVVDKVWFLGAWLRVKNAHPRSLLDVLGNYRIEESGLAVLGLSNHVDVAIADIVRDFERLEFWLWLLEMLEDSGFDGLQNLVLILGRFELVRRPMY